MALYNPDRLYTMQVHLQVNTVDDRDKIAFSNIKGDSIPLAMSKAYTQGVLYKVSEKMLQLIHPMQIKTIFFVLQE